MITDVGYDGPAPSLGCDGTPGEITFNGKRDRSGYRRIHLRQGGVAKCCTHYVAFTPAATHSHCTPRFKIIICLLCGVWLHNVSETCVGPCVVAAEVPV